MTVRVQQMDIPERGCHESRRESRMGGEALYSLCSEISLAAAVAALMSASCGYITADKLIKSGFRRVRPRTP